MTEAGEKWARNNYADHPTFTSTDSIYDQSEFWLRSFCAEVEKRADAKDDPSCNICRGKAFRELKRELLGEK